MILCCTKKRRISGNYPTVAAMRLTHFVRSATFLSAALLGASLAHTEDIKSIHPSGYVTDLAGILSADKRANLEALCTEVEQKTGVQIAVVTVRSLEGESVENYAVDLFKQLGVGNKKENRGVLLLIAPNNRKYRIEVGYGLEPVINDARAGDAGRAMVPYLRQGDYGRAAETGAWRLAMYIATDSGVTLSGQPPAGAGRNAGGFGGGGIFWIFSGVGILFALIPIVVVLSLIGRFFGGGGGRGGGLGSGGLPWLLLGMLADSASRRSSSDWGRGWGGGGFGGGSGGWGGGGGGGFGGFGGGSSGGGGASGGW